MRRSQGQDRRVVRAVGVVVAAGLASLASAPSAGAETVGGGAFAVQANLDALVIPVDAGALPSVTLPADGGGPFTASLANTDVLGLATIKSGNVSTEGTPDPGTADSSVTVADVDVLGLVKATVAKSTCSATTTSATGSAKVLDLVVAGIPLAVVDFGPNTKISLPVGTVTINEQVQAAPARARAKVRKRAKRARGRGARRVTRATTPQAITVNAVHVELDVLGLVTGDIVLGQSRCSVG